MSTAPHVDLDLAAMRADPYPILANLRRTAPIAFVPQLGTTLVLRRDDIVATGRRPDVFSNALTEDLMNVLIGTNMMRKDAPEHTAERGAIRPTISSRTVKTHWMAIFRAHAERLIDALPPDTPIDLFSAFAQPYCAECLKSVTGLTCMRWQDMDAWSQAMMDGIVNWVGDPEVKARCHRATAGIDATIDQMRAAPGGAPANSMLAVMEASGMSDASVRASLTLAISGGQNEPRDVATGATWALLTHPDQLAAVRRGEATWHQVFDEYVRWIAPIGMIPRKITQDWTIGTVGFEAGDRVYLMFGSANRDEAHVRNGEQFDVMRVAAPSLAFGAGPHFCAGAWISRAMLADVALPMLFERLKNLRLRKDEPVRITGWTFRGLLNLPVVWSADAR